jgi:hypothetical protein
MVVTMTDPRKAAEVATMGLAEALEGCVALMPWLHGEAAKDNSIASMYFSNCVQIVCDDLRKLIFERDAFTARVKELEAALEMAEVELKFLHAAVECNDPKAQLLLRVTNIKDRIRRAAAARRKRCIHGKSLTNSLGGSVLKATTHHRF